MNGRFAGDSSAGPRRSHGCPGCASRSSCGSSAQSLDQEEQRGLAEGLNEEQLAIYDLLTRPGPNLTDAEKKQIKLVAEHLLATLKRDKLVLDWRKGQQTRAAVQIEIEKELDEGLPASYDASLFQQKADAVFPHIFDSYWDDGQSIYDQAA